MAGGRRFESGPRYHVSPRNLMIPGAFSLRFATSTAPHGAPEISGQAVGADGLSRSGATRFRACASAASTSPPVAGKPARIQFHKPIESEWCRTPRRVFRHGLAGDTCPRIPECNPCLFRPIMRNESRPSRAKSTVDPATALDGSRTSGVGDRSSMTDGYLSRARGHLGP
jgi:hypothetical protein